jgi:hypothetical protein
VTANADRSAFRVNGTHPFACEESNEYLSRAHAVLAFITVHLSEAGSVKEMVATEGLLAGALNAVETLLELGLYQLEAEDRERALARPRAAREQP